MVTRLYLEQFSAINSKLTKVDILEKFSNINSKLTKVDISHEVLKPFERY